MWGCGKLLKTFKVRTDIEYHTDQVQIWFHSYHTVMEVLRERHVRTASTPTLNHVSITAKDIPKCNFTKSNMRYSQNSNMICIRGSWLNRERSPVHTAL